ncbi:MAG: tetratricopeptide repeat protein [Deltaproteobacteria bacterium]|nr:tetratricopeptide repeat protein [Deltaproteobacteria bacterium]
MPGLRAAALAALLAAGCPAHTLPPPTLAQAIEAIADDDCAAAEPMLHRLLDEERGDPAQLHHYLGVCRQTAGDLAGAEARYREALRVNPALYESINNLGVVLGEQGRHDESVAVLGMLVQAYPGEPEAHYNLGFEQAQAGDAEAALASFRRTAELDTCGVEALLQASEVLRGLGRLEERILVLEEAVRRRPGDGICAVALSRALREAGRMQDAVAPLVAAAADGANDASTVAAVALELRNLGRDDEALAAARGAMDRAGADGEALRVAALTFALIARAAGRGADAEAALREALDRLPGQPELSFFLGGLLAEQGRCDEAVPLLKAAHTAFAAADPASPQARETARALGACGAAP